MTKLSEKQREDLVALCTAASLTDVRTVLMHAQLAAMPSEGAVELHLAIDVQLKHHHIENGFVVTGDFCAHAQAPGGDGDLVRLSFGIVATYVLDKAAPPPSEEQVKTFAEYNSMIHLWPYFRAFVQQSCAQLGLPTLILPPFRAGQMAPRKPEQRK